MLRENKDTTEVGAVRQAGEVSKPDRSSRPLDNVRLWPLAAVRGIVFPAD